MGKLAKEYGDIEPEPRREVFEDWIVGFDDDDQAVIFRWVDSDASVLSVVKLIDQATGKRWGPSTIARLRNERGRG